MLCGGQPVTVGGATYSQEGQYTQTIPGTGCDTIVTINITEEQAPSVTILGNTQISANSTETYAIVQPQGYTITWSVVNGTILSGQGTVSATIFWDGNGFGEVSVTVSNSDCSYTTNLPVGLNVGISENLNTEVRITPNPSNGIFNIELNEPSFLAVMDMQGKRVLETNGNGRFSLNLNGFSKGTYILQVQTSKGLFAEKLILQ